MEILTQKNWINRLGLSWFIQLKPFLETDKINTIANQIANERRMNKAIYPSSEEVFTSFNLCDYDEVKVVVIGLNHYFKDEIKPINKLLELHKELEADLKILKVNFDYSLKEYASQGIFFLNDGLTYNRFPGNHSKIWKVFTDETFKCLDNKEFIIYVNFSNKELTINNNNHIIINMNEIPNSKLFSKINNELWIRNYKLINW